MRMMIAKLVWRLHDWLYYREPLNILGAYIAYGRKRMEAEMASCEPDSDK